MMGCSVRSGSLLLNRSAVDGMTIVGAGQASYRSKVPRSPRLAAAPYPVRYIFMNEVRQLREAAGLTQAELAFAAGTSQPTVAAYEAGRKSPTLRTLRRLAHAAGVEMVVAFHPPLTREDRRSLFLHRAIASRLAGDPGPVVERARATLTRMMDKHPGAAGLLREWDLLLDRPLPELLAVLTDPHPRARELRQVTPFAGVLSAAERAATYRAFAEEENAQ
jgi:transcriptional regulator with XRE-family HTH domain